MREVPSRNFEREVDGPDLKNFVNFLSHSAGKIGYERTLPNLLFTVFFLCYRVMNRIVWPSTLS